MWINLMINWYSKKKNSNYSETDWNIKCSSSSKCTFKKATLDFFIILKYYLYFLRLFIIQINVFADKLLSKDRKKEVSGKNGIFYTA